MNKEMFQIANIMKMESEIKVVITTFTIASELRTLRYVHPVYSWGSYSSQNKISLKRISLLYF
jgi:hypothetical protein